MIENEHPSGWILLATWEGQLKMTAEELTVTREVVRAREHEHQKKRPSKLDVGKKESRHTCNCEQAFLSS